MGICVPRSTVKAVTPPSTTRIFPDVSEYNGCALHSEAIIRVYEAGLYLTDTKARCHFEEAHRLKVWAGSYAFTRPGYGGCRYQADRAVAITKALGGLPGPVVDDAEVPETLSEVLCFEAEVRRLGYPAVEYTCPGCSDPKVAPVWIASYPYRPPGTWVAHQFSESWNCRGVYGDCSIDEGITSIVRKPPAPPITPAQRKRLYALYALRQTIRKEINVERAKERAARRHGDRVNAAITRLHQEGVH